MELVTRANNTTFIFLNKKWLEPKWQRDTLVLDDPLLLFSREEKRDVSLSKEHLRTMLTTREHNPSSHQPLRVLCRRQRLVTRAPNMFANDVAAVNANSFSISDCMRVPLGFGWTLEHSAL